VAGYRHHFFRYAIILLNLNMYGWWMVVYVRIAVSLLKNGKMRLWLHEKDVAGLDSAQS
jgi:uncharacterized protein YfaT (DUF1175 family)